MELPVICTMMYNSTKIFQKFF